MESDGQPVSQAKMRWQQACHDITAARCAPCPFGLNLQEWAGNRRCCHLHQQEADVPPCSPGTKLVHHLLQHLAALMLPPAL